MESRGQRRSVRLRLAVLKERGVLHSYQEPGEGGRWRLNVCGGGLRLYRADEVEAFIEGASAGLDPDSLGALRRT